uniref:Uncharacterized protein n=1 Tax=Arundo donax TaxID=35708 RepID=A0A0A9BYT3_ARUDO
MPYTHPKLCWCTIQKKCAGAQYKKSSKSANLNSLLRVSSFNIRHQIRRGC